MSDGDPIPGEDLNGNYPRFASVDEYDHYQLGKCFNVTTGGCGCCSENYYVNKKQAIAVCKAEIEARTKKLKEIEASEVQ